MGNVKALFFDIDGTLVSFNTHRIPQSAICAINRLRGQGVKVFIATGRPRPFIDNLGELEYDGIISVNGASCRLEDGAVVCHSPVPKDNLVRLMDYCRVNPISIAFASDDYAFLNADSDDVSEVFSLLHIPKPEIRPIEHCLEMDVMQVIAFFRKEHEDRIMSEVLPDCVSHRWHPNFTDVIAKGCSKSTGIDAVLAHYGIDISDVYAFGDGGNDIPMLRHVPNSVAMGNASDEVKRNAIYVTDTVDNEGIAKFLEQFLM